VSGSELSVVSVSPDELAAAIAGAQRGQASRAQLLEAGVHTQAIVRRVRNGRLIPRHRGVYAVGHAAQVEFADETAALLACGPTAVLSHHSAATIWGLRPGIARPIHVTVPAGKHGLRADDVVVHRSSTLTKADVTTHKDLPVTSPTRTVLDVAGTLPETDTAYVLEEGLANRLLTEAAIHELLRRAGNHPGAHALARVMRSREGGLSESNAQRRLLELIREAALPIPQIERPILDYRADLYWPHLRLIVEVDGYQSHGTRGAFEHDRRRDARLQAAGYVVIRISAIQIEREPLAVIARLAQALAAQEWLLGQARAPAPTPAPAPAPTG
jgi:very-short-patch-repair endonuclease